MPFPSDYIERAYAGVLGKIIGVYLGRPFEGWSYEKIMAQLGEVDHYVHDKVGVPLIVTDDDISGTFTFVRALADYGCRRDLTPAQIGQTWLNYLIDRRTILWWGGLGNSTEHTAYLRLKAGISAPKSGSIETNGPIVAQQIGAQIFIDGWAMVAPGDPALAADLARRAGSVSHDGEAVYGAQVLAAMEAQAFVERDIDNLIDTGVSFIPKESIIYRMIADLRGWAAADKDWRKTRERIVDQYGYKDFVGGCHMVPNHALIILGLLYGQGDFQKSLMICNTSGWDTDCNSGNLGCLLGIRNGLAGFEGPVDWRGPVADRIFLPSADGGRCITDAAAETYHIINAARGLQGLTPLSPKGGARYHFSLPGSLQGFCGQGGQVGNLPNRGLSLTYPALAEGAAARAVTQTFFLPEDLKMPGYELVGSPSLYPGQTLKAHVSAAGGAGVKVSLCLDSYDANDQLVHTSGPAQLLAAGEAVDLTWKIPASLAGPLALVGVEAAGATQPGQLILEWLTWTGAPETVFARPLESSLPNPGPRAWRKAWTNGVDLWEEWGAAFRIIQNSGRGLIAAGTREWTDYRVSAVVTPAMVRAGGIAARVQGMERFYALEVTSDQKIRLIKALDGQTVLAEAPFSWELWKPVELTLEVKGGRIRAWAAGQALFEVDDAHAPLTGGGVGLVCEEGHIMADEIRVGPVQ